MPKGSEQLTNARKEEIINACAKLYTTMNFKDITLKQISLETTFTRTSIYNYFQTKEEIFLALFQREYDLWTADIRQIFEKYEMMTVDEFASALAHTLEKRECLLKLLSMNHYDMESRSRLDNHDTRYSRLFICFLSIFIWYLSIYLCDRKTDRGDGRSTYRICSVILI